MHTLSCQPSQVWYKSCLLQTTHRRYTFYCCQAAFSGTRIWTQYHYFRLSVTLQTLVTSSRHNPPFFSAGTKICWSSISTPPAAIKAVTHVLATKNKTQPPVERGQHARVKALHLQLWRVSPTHQITPLKTHRGWVHDLHITQCTEGLFFFIMHSSSLQETGSGKQLARRGPGWSINQEPLASRVRAGVPLGANSRQWRHRKPISLPFPPPPSYPTIPSAVTRLAASQWESR